MRTFLLTLLCLSYSYIYAQQPVLVSDFNTGSADGFNEFNYNSISINGSLLIPTIDATLGEELGIISNGEINILKDINIGTESSSPTQLTWFNNAVYFTAYDEVSKWALWKTDGTEAGTTLAFDIDDGENTSRLIGLVATDDYLYFTYDFDLYAYDGLNAEMISESVSFRESFNQKGKNYSTFENGLVFLSEDDDAEVIELYSVDGTEVTYLTSTPQGGFADVYGLSPVEGGLIFAIEDPFGSNISYTYIYDFDSNQISTLDIGGEEKLARRLENYTNESDLAWIAGEGYYLLNGLSNQEKLLYQSSNTVFNIGESIQYSVYNDNMVFHATDGLFGDNGVMFTDGTVDGTFRLFETTNYFSNFVLNDQYAYFADGTSNLYEPDIYFINMETGGYDKIFSYEESSTNTESVLLVGVLDDKLYYISNLDQEVGRELYSIDVAYISSLADVDQDGYFDNVDCDDNNSNINPGAYDVGNNGIDEDCDGEDFVYTAGCLTDLTGGYFALTTVTNQSSGTSWSECEDQEYDGIISILEDTLNPGSYIVYSWTESFESLIDMSFGAYQICDGAQSETDYPAGSLRLVPECESLTITGMSQWGNSYTVSNVTADESLLSFNWTNDIEEGAFVQLFKQEGTWTFEDDDNDGYLSSDDCDDSNPMINPSAVDVPLNGIDEDCDGQDATDLIDNDNDGFASDIDCDDNNPEVNPSATEMPYNGIDDDCDPMTLDDDLDGDGFVLDEDCDDTDSGINPNATDIPDNGIDENCDGSDAMSIVDADNDGFDNDEDCDDNNPEVNPSVVEMPYNGIDDDCNPLTLDDDLDQDGFVFTEDCDDNDPNLNPEATDIPDNGIDEDCDGMDATNLVDNDNDGYDNDMDCDDNNPNINPGATEITYNGIDDDCDPMTLDDDLDQDGFVLDEDCDDTNAGINPNAADIPDNGIDEDCDGIDATNIVDADNDGFDDSVDCDDTNPNINPGAAEITYNGIDDDCNPMTLDDDLDQDGFVLDEDCDDSDSGINPNAADIPDNGIDEDCDGIDATNIVDADNDGFDDSVDCDDTNPNINPGAAEITYNGIDDDCDPMTLDDDLDQDGFVLDEDCDDFNASINPAADEVLYNEIDDDCDPTTLDNDLDQDGYDIGEDCDDSNSDVNPGQSELPYNGVDDDCNPETLDDDLDGDGFGIAFDCDDTDNAINPAILEVIYNGIDDDCNPETLDDDLDQDGFVMAEDCDDFNPNLSPGNTEIPYNGFDDDCDATTPDDDLDGDGFLLVNDCDDTNADINPSAEDIPNNDIDENCDGLDAISAIQTISGITIDIYPNPARDFITIQLSQQITMHYAIYALNGQQVVEGSTSNLVTQVDVNHLKSGLYLVRLIDDQGGSAIERIIVEH